MKATYDASQSRWDAIPVWGTGWFVGAIVILAAVSLIDHDRAVWLAFLLLPVAGAAVVGVPTFIVVQRNGSRAPRAQALVWVVGFTIAAALVLNTVRDHHGLAQPGDVNVNTTETMRQRQASFTRWGTSPEVMSSFFFSVAAIFSLAVTTGIVSGVVATKPTAPHRWLSVLGFGFAAGLGILAALWAGAAASLFPPAAPFVAGCTAGAIIEWARFTLLHNRAAL